MAPSDKELNRLEDALVHDEQDPMPEGWGIYATPRHLAAVCLCVYALMLAGMVVTQVIYRNSAVPRLLMPESLLIGLPIAVVALYIRLVSPPEAELVKKRTFLGRLVTLVIAWVAMQAATILLWWGMVRAFTLQ